MVCVSVGENVWFLLDDNALQWSFVLYGEFQGLRAIIFEDMPPG